MVATIVGAVLVEVATGSVSWLGDKLSGQEPLISYSTELEVNECGSTAFLPNEGARAVLSRPFPGDWEAVLNQPGAIPAEWASVQVAIQGESARTITLLGIDFSVERLRQPRGATFSAPCGGPVNGRGVEVDLDLEPPKVVASSKTQEGSLGPGESTYEVQPITWPWTVSLTDSLLLFVVATTDSCYCVWKAEIPWVSGGERGTIQLDNGGAGFPLIAADGVPGYTTRGKHWGRYVFRDGRYVWKRAG